MPMCGFNQEMLNALTDFSKGLLEQIIKRARRDSISIEKAMEIEVEELNIFLALNSEKYHNQLRPKHSVTESMEKLIEWGAHDAESAIKKEIRPPSLITKSGGIR